VVLVRVDRPDGARSRWRNSVGAEGCTNAAAGQVNRDSAEQDVWQNARVALAQAEVARHVHVTPLTRYVLDEALRQGRQWSDAGHQLSVAVNVSARRLLDLEFPITPDDLTSWLGQQTAAPTPEPSRDGNRPTRRTTNRL
jgi:hypothetical protein